MRRFLIALALAASPMIVTGCSTIAAWTGHEEVVTYDERALLTAEYAFETASVAIQATERAGQLNAERAGAVRPIYLAAYEKLILARAMYDANRDVEASTQTQIATTAVADLLKVLVEQGMLERFNDRN